MTEKSAVITVRLSRRNLERIEVVRALENVEEGRRSGQLGFRNF